MATNATLKDKKIVLTGKFKGMARKAAGEELKKHGAKVSGSVSGKTDLLIAGGKAGSKLYKAYDAKVPILGEGHLKMLLDGTPVDEVVALARTFYTYELSREPNEGDETLHRVGGVAPGVGEDRWPRGGDAGHLFTLDLDALPALKAQYPDYRTMSVFCSDPSTVTMYEIGRPGNGYMSIVWSTQAQIDEAPKPPKGKADDKPYWHITIEARGWDELNNHFGGRRILGAVPCWCQYEQHQGNFIMQTGESLGLGGDGLMYVFDDTIFAQFT